MDVKIVSKSVAQLPSGAHAGFPPCARDDFRMYPVSFHSKEGRWFMGFVQKADRNQMDTCNEALAWRYIPFDKGLL